TTIDGSRVHPPARYCWRGPFFSLKKLQKRGSAVPAPPAGGQNSDMESKTPSRFDPLALSMLIGVVVMLSFSFLNQRKVNRLEERLGRIEAQTGVGVVRGPDPNRIYTVKIADAPAKGAESAPVTIVEFSDFQCPFCGRAEPTLKQI